MTSEQLAYIGGFFDGEGSISCIINRNGVRRLSVNITNTCYPLIEDLHNRFGGLIHEMKVRERTGKTIGLRKQCYRWDLNGKRAVLFLSAVSPYILVKRKQVKLAMEFLDLPDGQSERKTETVFELRELNRGAA